MKGDLIISIFVDISLYPYEFSILREFIICSVSFGVVHLHPILCVRFIKCVYNKMSVIINTIIIIIYKTIFILSSNICCDSNKIIIKIFSNFFLSEIFLHSTFKSCISILFHFFQMFYL